MSMNCPKCNFNPGQLDIYRFLDLDEHHKERKRWQENPEHRKTLEFYAWFISAFAGARVLDVGSGPGTVGVPLSRLANVSSVVCFDSNPQVRTTLSTMKAKEDLSKI